MTARDDLFTRIDGFCICEGDAEGVLFRAASPYEHLDQICEDTILVLKYPASTFLRMMLKAGGVLAQVGTSKVEAARFMARQKKPVLFGAGDLSSLPQDGVRIRLSVNSDNTAFIRLV